MLTLSPANTSNVSFVFQNVGSGYLSKRSEDEDEDEVDLKITTDQLTDILKQVTKSQDLDDAIQALRDEMNLKEHTQGPSLDHQSPMTDTNAVVLELPSQGAHVEASIHEQQKVCTKAWFNCLKSALSAFTFLVFRFCLADYSTIEPFSPLSLLDRR